MKTWTDYTCKKCGKEWQTNEGEKEECPICKEVMDKYYNKL